MTPAYMHIYMYKYMHDHLRCVSLVFLLLFHENHNQYNNMTQKSGTKMLQQILKSVRKILIYQQIIESGTNSVPD